MTTHRLLLGLFLGWFVSTLGLQAAEDKNADLNFRVQLIWGANDEKPSDPSLKEVAPAQAEKLKKVFKWKRYYEVKQLPMTVHAGQANKVKLSDKCELEVKDLGKATLEAKLFGQGKLVKKVTHPVIPGDCLIMAGDGKDDTAWFVVLMPK